MYDSAWEIIGSYQFPLSLELSLAMFKSFRLGVVLLHVYVV